MRLVKRKTTDFAGLSQLDVFSFLGTTSKGLSQHEAESRLREYGRNEILEHRTGPAKQFAKRLWGPMPWLLEFASAFAFVLGRTIEGAIIVVLLLINAAIGLKFGRNSRNALELLRSKLLVKARILRDELLVTCDAACLVPGDIFLIRSGGIVPADAMVLDGQLTIDQSTLTGESFPVKVESNGIVFASSSVKRGQGKCVTLNTGQDTLFGRTAELVKVAAPRSHQEEIMLGIIKYMMLVGLTALGIVIAEGLILGQDLFQILTIAVIFLMAAVPVALPAVLTIVQGVGAINLVEKGALVTRLDSVEDGATMDVLCFDKTGTITENRLTVVEVLPKNPHTSQELLEAARLASSPDAEDAVDDAIIQYATRMGWSDRKLTEIAFTPFESTTRFAEATLSEDGHAFRVIKGSPETVISLCYELNSDPSLNSVQETIDSLSLQGYKSLAVARSHMDDPTNLQFLGLLSIADPLRPDSKETIDQIMRLGIRPFMLTGDSIALARQVARDVGIDKEIVTMEDVARIDYNRRAELIDNSGGFAQILPEDKYEVVRLLQSKGHIVGMTGDGVNDAPAIKQAELGIAVSNSTDVAKSSASVVLTRQGMSSIIEVVNVGRKVYERMLSWVINKITRTIQVVGILTLGFLWLHSMLVSLFGMTLLVFANDFATLSLSTDNVKPASSVGSWNIRKLTSASIPIASILVVEGLVTLYLSQLLFPLTFVQLQSTALLMLVFTSQSRVLSIRERRHFWSSVPGRELLFSAIFVTTAFATFGTLGIIVPRVPILLVTMLLCLATLFTFPLDLVKYASFKRIGLK